MNPLAAVNQRHRGSNSRVVCHDGDTVKAGDPIVSRILTHRHSWMLQKTQAAGTPLTPGVNRRRTGVTLRAQQAVKVQELLVNEQQANADLNSARVNPSRS